MLIDSTYFVNELLIANISNTVDSTGSKITSFIEKYETRYLKELLGLGLYAEFIAGIAEDPIEEKWAVLLDALRNDTTKESPIANYVYYWVMRNDATQSTGTGEVVANNENSRRVSPVDKMVRAWNEMVDWNDLIFEVLNNGNYPSYAPNTRAYCEHGRFYNCYNDELYHYQNTLNL